MKAGVQFEGAVEVSEGDVLNLNRNTFVSLGGGFGEVRVGLHDTPLKDIRSKLDLFGDRVGDLRNLTRLGTITIDTGTGDISVGNAWDERFKNGILYISPKIADSWWIKAHYTTNKTTEPAQTVIPETATSYKANDDTAYSLGANGMIGPVGVWLAYENYDYSGNRDSETAMRVGLQYKGGPLMVNFLYQTSADQRITVDATNGSYDRDVMSIGLGYKMGKNTFLLQYAMADDISCSNGIDCSDAKTAATTMGIGVDHELSKDSTVSVMYAMTANDDDAFYTVTGGGGHGDSLDPTFDPTTGNGEDSSAFSVGYIVKF
jgi:predicted porin